MQHKIRFFTTLPALLCLAVGFAGVPSIAQADSPAPADNTTDVVVPDVPLSQQYIRAIRVTGNKQVPTEAILYKTAFREGEQFHRERTRQTIVNLFNLGYFKNITISYVQVSTTQIDLQIHVEEEKRNDGITITGNNHLSEKEIKKTFDYSDLPTLSEHTLDHLARTIKKLYGDKNYHDAVIETVLNIDGELATGQIIVAEGAVSSVRRIRFDGNEHITSKHLRSRIATQEDWLFSFMNNAGTYKTDMVEYDKQVIENIYQSNGFLTARVTSVDVDRNDATHEINLTYFIQEGPQYVVTQLSVPGNDLMSERELLQRIPIRVGQLYSREDIQQTIENLRTLWGEFGYINADIEPIIQTDDEEHTVQMTFRSELGNKVRLNRLNIIGNKKTRDKVIRRQIKLEEGDVVTNRRMEISKSNVERMGYFDKRDGVNWRVRRLTDDMADLDLMVKEGKSGHISGGITVGGDPHDSQSPADAIKFRGDWEDSNFLGKGITVNVTGELGKREQNINFVLANPWLFDRPLGGTVGGYYRGSDYDDVKDISGGSVNEQRGGGFVGLSFFAPGSVTIRNSLQIGAESLSYKSAPRALLLDIAEKDRYQALLNRRFRPGDFLNLGYHIAQDLRDHAQHPSNGYQWNVSSRVGLPLGACPTSQCAPVMPTGDPENPVLPSCDKARFGFFKLEGDFSWYTPLIGHHDLILAFHTHVGYVKKIGSEGNTIPYRELFHIGGPATVRGFRFGEIGPVFKSNSSLIGSGSRTSLGATKTFWVNLELIFPIKPDFSMTGHLFYDGGAGWDTLDPQLAGPNLLNNDLDYRHAIGFGFRMLQPFPIQLDWGFKLDRRTGEKTKEAHFSMSHYY